MVGSETVFASASLRRWHSICTHHFLTTIPSSVYQHQHGHDGNTFSDKTLASLCFASVWRYSSHLVPQHRRKGDFLWVRRRRQLASSEGMQNPKLSVDYTKAKLSFVLTICVSLTCNCRKLHLKVFNSQQVHVKVFVCLLTFFKVAGNNCWNETLLSVWKQKYIADFYECSANRKTIGGITHSLWLSEMAGHGSRTNQH